MYTFGTKFLSWIQCRGCAWCARWWCWPGCCPGPRTSSCSSSPSSALSISSPPMWVTIKILKPQHKEEISIVGSYVLIKNTLRKLENDLIIWARLGASNCTHTQQLWIYDDAYKYNVYTGWHDTGHLCENVRLHKPPHLWSLVIEENNYRRAHSWWTQVHTNTGLDDM